MEFMYSEKGKKLVVFENFKFRHCSVTKLGIKWRCTNKNCTSKLFTDEGMKTILDPQSGNLRNFIYVVNPVVSTMTRVSTSCPSLNEIMTDFDVLTASIGSSPLHQTSRKSSDVQDWLYQPEIQRRMSWSAVEDIPLNDKSAYYRQRSISLSSMESEADESSLVDNVDCGGDSSKILATSVKHRSSRSSGGATSTHSLNEADLQNDYNIVKVRRQAEEGLVSQRLPLQKSISTPSILAVRELGTDPSLKSLMQPVIPTITLEGHGEKRRKRGSIFFRKKKDKNKRNAHQWVSSCYTSSYVCDVCNKQLSNKSALYCDCCGITVHQRTCKDNNLECVKGKGVKNNIKTSEFSNCKVHHTKRGSLYLEGTQSNVPHKQILYDERDSDFQQGHCDVSNFADDIPLIAPEFLTDSPLTAGDLCSDVNLGLHENEPDSWTSRAGKEIARKLKEKEVKRQEHIYEFILTEKHHCITLLVVQKIFVEGLQKYFQLGTCLERMFPRLMDLIELHLEFLSRLRERQKENAVVLTIADILEEQFSNQNALKLKSAYGEFCSKHRDAVEIYKDYLHSDPRFEQFVRHCQCNPLLKKKGIPECILFITQRLTKYPLLIEPLIKTSKENKKEQESLQRTLNFVKDILMDVDSQVAEKEKEDRKLEIYNKIDAKSYTVHKGLKFKKSDILQKNRSLKFEGVAMLMQGRSKMQLVLVIVLSDILFFLQETSQKYIFFTPDNKAGVVSLQKLLVREKAGQDSRGIYLISSNPAYPEMFELKVHKPKDKQIWIHAIREAVQSCPEEDEDNLSLAVEDKQDLVNPQKSQIRHIVGLLRQKDVEQALLFEEKISLQLKLLSASGVDPPSPPTYRHLVNENVDSGLVWKEVFIAVQEVSRLASSLYVPGVNLSRSVSSVGEHQSETYVSPILPKRAETFGGFDSSNQNPSKLPGKKNHASSATLRGTTSDGNQKYLDLHTFEGTSQKTDSGISGEDLNSEQNFSQSDTDVFCLGREQQNTVVQISHYVYNLLCIISQLMTTNESYQAQINALKSGVDGIRQYKHNQQLEELRNLQDKLSAEKSTWNATRDQEMKELEEKRSELLKLQEHIRSEQEDIKSQREQLFRTMEKLTNKGLLISPNVGTFALSGQSEETTKDESEDIVPTDGSVSISSANIHNSFATEKKKECKWNKNSQTKSQLPINLISATNQKKVPQNVHVKQQIPLKLASRLSPSTTGNSAQLIPLKLSQDEKSRRTNLSGYQRLNSPSGEANSPVAHFHSRAGSSPAMMDVSHSDSTHPQTSATSTNTFPKNGDEEVIYF